MLSPQLYLTFGHWKRRPRVFVARLENQTAYLPAVASWPRDDTEASDPGKACNA